MKFDAESGSQTHHSEVDAKKAGIKALALVAFLATSGATRRPGKGANRSRIAVLLVRIGLTCSVRP
jgi:hypothetical protein